MTRTKSGRAGQCPDAPPRGQAFAAAPGRDKNRTGTELQLPANGQGRSVPVLSPLTAAARTALETAHGDILRAKAQLAGCDDPAVREALIELGAVHAINGQIHTARVRTWSPPDATRQADRVKALARGNLYAFPLPGGLTLGMARKREVMAAADLYRTHADNMAAKARFLAAVAAAMPSGRVTVRKAIALDQLSRMQEAAIRGT